MFYYITLFGTFTIDRVPLLATSYRNCLPLTSALTSSASKVSYFNNASASNLCSLL